MVCRRLVKVVRTGDRHDRFQMWRLLDRGLHLGAREIADADHADVAIRPRLGGGPLDQVVHVLAFLAIEETKGATRSARAATVGNDVDVTSWHEEIAGTGFDETSGRAEVLHLARIGRGRYQHGVAARFRGTMDVGKQVDAITHRHLHVIVAGYRMNGLREVAILAPCCLRTIEPTLSGFDARYTTGSHTCSPMVGRTYRASPGVAGIQRGVLLNIRTVVSMAATLCASPLSASSSASPSTARPTHSACSR